MLSTTWNLGTKAAVGLVERWYWRTAADVPRPDGLEPSTVLTVKEACQRLRISRWSLYELIRTHQLRTFQIGRRRFVSQKALADLITRLEREAD